MNMSIGCEYEPPRGSTVCLTRDTTLTDFNNNGFVDSDDIEETIQRLTVNEGLHDPGLMECLIESVS